jgi:hypothetical protein
MGGSFAAMRILTGDGGRWISRGGKERLKVLGSTASVSCCSKCCLPVFDLRGVFQSGLILPSGSTPSFFARARVMRRGGDAILPLFLPGRHSFRRCRERKHRQTESCLRGGGDKENWGIRSSDLPATKCKQMRGHHPVPHLFSGLARVNSQRREAIEEWSGKLDDKISQIIFQIITGVL